MNDRGMKKWAPYKALKEQYEELEKLHQKRKLVSKPRISSDVAENINLVLTEYHQQELILTRYHEGNIQKERIRIVSIDKTGKRLVTESHETVPFSEILNLEDA